MNRVEFSAQKRIGEELPFAIDWASVIAVNFPDQVLGLGTSITITDLTTKQDVTASMLSSTAYTTTKLTGVIRGGDMGKTYYCLYRGETQAGYVLEDVILLQIIR